MSALAPPLTPSVAGTDPSGTRAPDPLPLAQQAHPQTLLHSDALMQGSKTVAISHNGTVYRLQATRQGKLILTK